MIYCENCGKKINDSAKFCGNCGAQIVNRENQTNTNVENDISKEETPIADQQKHINERRMKKPTLSKAFWVFGVFSIVILNMVICNFNTIDKESMLEYAVLFLICGAICSIIMYVYQSRKKEFKPYEEEFQKKKDEYSEKDMVYCDMCASVSIETVVEPVVIRGRLVGDRIVNVCQTCGHKWKPGKK